MQSKVKLIGMYCKMYRKNELKLSLKEFCEKTGGNYKNVSAFERGLANNIQYLDLYYTQVPHNKKSDFAKGLFEYSGEDE